MTAPRRDGVEAPFNAWVRNHPRLHSLDQCLAMTDSDLWVHKWDVRADGVGKRVIQALMLVEIKTFGSDVSSSQRDTLEKIDAFLSHKRTRKIGKSVVRSFGVHLLRFLDGSSPENSRRIEWSKRCCDHRVEITTDQLVELLLFELHPSTLVGDPFRRHHTLPFALKIQRPLDLDRAGPAGVEE
jgi:hypothetical protein